MIHNILDVLTGAVLVVLIANESRLADWEQRFKAKRKAFVSTAEQSEDTKA